MGFVQIIEFRTSKIDLTPADTCDDGHYYTVFKEEIGYIRTLRGV